MTEFKLLGSLLILAAGAGGAILSARTEQRKLTVLDGWIDLIAHVRARIDCYLTPLDEILSALDPELVRRCGGSLPCRSCAALLQSASPALSPEGRRLIGAFVSGIGDGYREEQVRACDYYLDALRELRKKTAAELPARIRVRAALCLTAALGAAILLW